MSRSRSTQSPLSISSLLAAALFAVTVAIPWAIGVRESPQNFRLEIEMSSTRSGFVQVFLDDGAGYREQLSSRGTITGDPAGRRLSLSLPPGVYRSFRFDPVNADGVVTISTFRVVDREGETLHEIPLNEISGLNHIQSLAIDDGKLIANIQPGSEDPQLLIRFNPALDLGRPWGEAVGVFLRLLAFVFLLLVGALAAATYFPRLRGLTNQAVAWTRNHPRSAIAVAATIGMILASYPVIFLGRSYVSPNFSDGSVLLYEGFPTLPGYDDATVEKVMGSDVGALGWHHLPLSMIEHRALLHDKEWPLFNRYNSSGVALLGQGQAMFGDPLHFIPIAANGAAWAWDFKFLIARWLFGLGLGLSVFTATRHLPAALLTAGTSLFIGFFIYRVNHPAIFSLCYAPWILFAWLHIAQASSARQTARALLVLALANWMELTSGTVKEAYALLLSLNLTGTLILLTTPDPWSNRARKLSAAVGVGVLFACVSAPIWLTFYHTLSVSYTSYDNPAAFQINPSLLLGLFDEIFYRAINVGERVYNPSANFLVLVGVLYVIATLRRTPFDRWKTALLVGAAGPLALAFGFFPPEWIVRIPFFRNIAHIDNTFSCVLIIHLIILAGYGFKLGWERMATPEGRGDLTVVGALLLALIVPWVALTHTISREPYGPGTTFRLLQNGQHLPVSDFAWGSLLILPTAALGLLLALRRARLAGRWTPSALIVGILLLGMLLWRHGQHGTIGFSDYVYNPGVRVNLHAPSPAIDYINGELTDPYRVVGFDSNLIPGWSAAYGLETISGPDAVASREYRELLFALRFERIWDWRVMTRMETIAGAKRGYDFLNTKYYLRAKGSESELSGGLIRTQQADLDVFESQQPWPRAFYTDRISISPSAPEVAALVHSGDGRPFAAVAPTVTGPFRSLSVDQSTRTIVPARNYELTVNSTTFDIETPGRGLVVLHETWYPDSFAATVNGTPVDCLRINHAFKGVFIETAGSYRVSFTYRPPLFRASLAAASVALLGFIALAWLAWRRQRA